MDDRIPIQIASSFARTTGIERDDLIQEARLALWRAEGRYDPRVAALSTYATHCVTRRLCSVAEQHARRHPRTEELPDGLASPEPGPEESVAFSELIRDLPEDARVVVSLVLCDAAAMAGMTRSAAMSAIRELLPWPTARLEAACEAVSRALRTGGRPARTRWAINP